MAERMEESRPDFLGNSGLLTTSVSEKLYHDLIENGLGFICAHDANGKLLMVNRAAAEALEYSVEELTGRNLRELIPPGLERRFDSYLRQVLREGTAGGYLQLLTRAGKHVVWLYRNRLYQELHRPAVVFGHAQNVTGKIDMERRLRESNEKYRRLFEDAPVAYHEIDSRGIVVRLNRAECELLGHEKEQVLGRPVWELVSPENQEESRRNVKRKLAGEQPLVPFLREFTRRDGSRVLARIHENLIRSREGKIIGIRSTMLDVTEQYRSESELRRLNAELDRRVADRTAELNLSHERMREFVYTVSHDLQEPLRSMTSFARLLVERYSDRLDADGNEFLRYVSSGAMRMSKLIRDLLSYSRVLHDEPDSFENVPLNGVLEIVREILNNSITSSGALITHDDLPEVRANPNRMVQLLQNLVSNAIKYRSVQPPVVHIGASRQVDAWIISVTDNGIGVAEADRTRIFGLFRRTNGRVASGSGVGLAICHAVVDRLGGRIWVESRPEGGCRFLFTIPDRHPEARSPA
jgi:PAS domain S-box-containing protein